MHSGFALAEKVGEVLGVELAEAASIVDGLAYDEHRGEGEVVVVDDLCEVFQLATIDLLVWPSQMIAGGNGRILRVFLQEFTLNIIDNGCREEDAHRTLTLGQQMQLLFLWHRSPSLTTSEDDGLTTLRNRELALQFGSGSEE